MGSFGCQRLVGTSVGLPLRVFAERASVMSVMSVTVGRGTGYAGIAVSLAGQIRAGYVGIAP